MTNRHKTIACALALMAISTSGSAWGITSVKEMRFHCEKDTTEINALLIKGKESGLHQGNKLVAFYANELLGKPYAAGTLNCDDKDDPNKELLTINIDELDCTTFIDALYALARTTMSGRYSWRDYARNLEAVRYRGGEMNGYASRMHYISDWIANNVHRGNLREVTADLDDVRYIVRSLDYMSKHASSYPQLADEEVLEKIKQMEIGYMSHRFPYIKKETISKKKAQSMFKDGDIIAIVTRTEGLDVQHMGVIKMQNGMPYLLNASSVGKKVQVEKDDLLEYLRRNRSAMGVRVIRLTD